MEAEKKEEPQVPAIPAEDDKVEILTAINGDKESKFELDRYKLTIAIATVSIVFIIWGIFWLASIGNGSLSTNNTTALPSGTLEFNNSQDKLGSQTSKQQQEQEIPMPQVRQGQALKGQGSTSNTSTPTKTPTPAPTNKPESTPTPTPKPTDKPADPTSTPTPTPTTAVPSVAPSTADTPTPSPTP